ncbi:MAG: hypothetical protein AABX10_03550 [Nanoarchaeota archaeon]
MVGGIDNPERRHPNGRKIKRDLLKALNGKEVIVIASGFVRKAVLEYTNAVYVDGVQLPITAVQRVYEDNRIKLYGESQ